jgi:UrcA family protein
MLSKTLQSGLSMCVGLAAACGLSLGGAHAQPYDAAGPSGDYAYTSEGITVYSNPAYGRTWNGAPVVVTRATRVVNTSDLDLTTALGQHVLRDRVERAAANACDELDNSWIMGLYPLPDESDADCYAGAVSDAMVRAQYRQ